MSAALIEGNYVNVTPIIIALFGFGNFENVLNASLIMLTGNDM
ncbi:hypothetical protein [Caldivirga sp. UBA161]|nr:hypothetical protein [Caldivirga sp. UBA161]